MSNDRQELNSPPTGFVSCYVTAKRIHSDKLLQLRALWPKIYFTARWPVVRNISTEQNRPAPQWINDNTDDITRSDVVLCYAEKDDLLVGSIWELGIAWAHNKPIYIVGENDAYKEWTHAMGIRRVPVLNDALSEISARLRYDRNDANRIMDTIRDCWEKTMTKMENLEERVAKVVPAQITTAPAPAPQTPV